jgi:putative ABC transport system ATP-binding protein
MNETNYLLKTENLDMKFDRPDGTPLVVLCDVSLSVCAGDMLALMGPNGCGKTTLLRIIAGEITQTSGKVFIADCDAKKISQHKRAKFIGRVHQESYKSLASDLTVEETLALAVRRNAALSLRFPNYANMMEILNGLSEAASEFVASRSKLATRTLSGGQRQLLAIIAATLGKPRVLLLDEHLTALDDYSKEVANELTNQFVTNTNGAFVAITHDCQWAEKHVKNVVRFSNNNFYLEDIQK